MNAPQTRTDIPVYEPHDLEVDGQLISHNVWVDGHRTSVRLEAVMWQALHEIADRETLSIHQVITIVSRRQHQNASLTATIRAFLVAYYRAVSKGVSTLLLRELSELPSDMKF